MGRRFAISDIHGCAETFRKLVVEILRFSHEDTLYLLGDYINKGPDSKGVFDFIFALQDAGHRVFCLKGNHEAYLLQALDDTSALSDFLARGGGATLDSFGVNVVSAIPRQYLGFMERMALFHEIERYILVHAGFDFELDDPFQDEFSMLNIRRMQVDMLKTQGRKIVHGHVPTVLSDIKKNLYFSFDHISIDGGCVYSHIHSLSQLVAIDIDSLELYHQKNIDLP